MRSHYYLLLAMAPLPVWSAAQDCGKYPGLGKPWAAGGAALFRSAGFSVDADGAPNSYLVNGNGLSRTCDGVAAIENGRALSTRDAGWQEKCAAAWKKATGAGDYSAVSIFGFATGKDKRPLIQGQGDPLPGTAYISTTSVPIPDAPEGTQRRYVDAVKIPYIVLPGSFIKTYKVQHGSLAVVYRKKTNTHAFAVYADGGNLGEGSVKLHQDLGSQPIVLKSGVARAAAGIADPVLVAVFPARVAPPVADAATWNARIKQEGEAALAAFGGLEKLQACAR